MELGQKNLSWCGNLYKIQKVITPQEGAIQVKAIILIDQNKRSPLRVSKEAKLIKLGCRENGLLSVSM